jgi:hypothetical protein
MNEIKRHFNELNNYLRQLLNDLVNLVQMFKMTTISFVAQLTAVSN